MRIYGDDGHIKEFPDVHDIQAGARKSSVGRLPEKGGDYKGYIRSSKTKRALRRALKRNARRQGRAEITLALME